MVGEKVPYYVPFFKLFQRFDQRAALFAVEGQIPIKLMKYILWSGSFCYFLKSSSIKPVCPGFFVVGWFILVFVFK